MTFDSEALRCLHWSVRKNAYLDINQKHMNNSSINAKKKKHVNIILYEGTQIIIDYCKQRGDAGEEGIDRNRNDSYLQPDPRSVLFRYPADVISRYQLV